MTKSHGHSQHMIVNFYNMSYELPFCKRRGSSKRNVWARKSAIFKAYSYHKIDYTFNKNFHY